jgi:hypothetical protein
MGTKKTSGVPASSLGIGVRKMRVEAGMRVAVAGGRLGVASWVGERTGGKVGAGGMKAGGRRMR